ncbi:uncharacterized protein LOC122349358 [Puntigrus tetrazona]|uniref:uncharacterized protein LOC122349358 n=1 Tax=Puntigrus tetrazona TaxID=1606681 RepID=UPI001C88FAC8|nr:uncharacterized protein LOC122349358 [Puntigrus tetrazona]
MRAFYKSLLFLLGFFSVRTKAEIEVNVSAWGTAIQSSDNADWYAWKAVDGSNSTCSHTTSQTDPWWKLDLMKTYRVNRVTLTNRLSCCEERINGAEIRIGNNSTALFSNPLCAVVSSIPAGTTSNYSCNGMEGRYVIVDIPGELRILSLCEVVVYVIGNLATGKTVTQSSTYGTWIAEQAIDLNPNFMQPWSACSSTNFQTDPWWRLDLGSVYRVNRVVVTNRLDCCSERINGAEITIGNSLENNGNNNPICAVIPSIPADASSTFTCNGMEGQYINLFIPGDSKILALCEVEVYGEGESKQAGLMKLKSSSSLSDPEMRVQLLSQLRSALAKQGVSGVTLQWTQPPEKVVMWKEDAPNFNSGFDLVLEAYGAQYYTSFVHIFRTRSHVIDIGHLFCSQTSSETDPWYRVDLLNEYQVKKVAITNRDDVNSYQRINGAVIRVGNFSDNVYSNTICAVISTIPSGDTASFSCGGLVGRYVIVHIPGDQQILTLCELEVSRFLRGNWASKGTALQSSTSGNWFAQKAIDGNRGLQLFYPGCSSTLNQSNPWWRVDLKNMYQISRVVVTNRNDCCPEQINNTEIRIGSSLDNDGNNNPICAVIAAIPAGESYSFSCNGMEGRYVNLIIPGDMKILTLCEVEVFGKGPILKRSVVKMMFNSRADLTDPKMKENAVSFEMFPHHIYYHYGEELSTEGDPFHRRSTASGAAKKVTEKSRAFVMVLYRR